MSRTKKIYSIALLIILALSLTLSACVPVHLKLLESLIGNRQHHLRKVSKKLSNGILITNHGGKIF